MKYNFYYGLLHWLIHFFFALLLVWATEFHLIDLVFPGIPNYVNSSYATSPYKIMDLIIVYFITIFLDIDHIRVYRKYGRKGILRFAQTRITYPFHNFFLLSIFGITSAFSALLLSRVLAILLLVPVVHLLWDMLEDVFIFRTTYRKWEKTWGIGSKELADMWKEWERIDRELKKRDNLIRRQK